MEKKNFILITLTFIYSIILNLNLYSQEISGDFYNLKFTGQVRLRPTFTDNYDFNADIKDTDLFNTQRARLGIEGIFYKNYHVVIQFQDSRIWGETPNSENHNLDLYQGFYQIDRLFNSNITLRMGRQELIYGDKRLVGNSDWSSKGRSFDAFKLSWEPAIDKFKLDMWVSQTKREKVDEKIVKDIFWGAYSTLSYIKQTDIDLYFLSKIIDIYEKSDLEKGKIFCPGLRIKGLIFNNLDYSLEGAFQFGEEKEIKRLAFAFAGVLKYNFYTFLKPSILVEYDIASGDDDFDDDTNSEFDNFYGANHSYYGYIDFLSWINMQDIHFKGSITFPRGLSIELDYHALFLLKEGGKWYDSGQKILDYKDISTITDENEIKKIKEAGKFLGNEFDLTFNYLFNKNFKVATGASLFLPQSAAKVRRGDDPAYMIYFQPNLSF